MSKASISWIKLNIRSVFSHASFYLMAIMLFLTIKLLGCISIGAQEDVRVLIFSEDSNIGDEIITSLLDEPYLGFDFDLADNRQALIKEVTNGYADCGVIFNEKFDKRISQGKIKGCVELYQNSGSYSGYIAREMIFPFVMQRVSNYLITDYVNDVTDNEADKEALDYALGVNDRFNNETSLNIFNMVTFEGIRKNKAGRFAAIRYIALSITAIIIALIMYSESEKENRNYYKALMPKVVRIRRLQSLTVKLVLSVVLLLIFSVIL